MIYNNRTGCFKIIENKRDSNDLTTTHKPEGGPYNSPIYITIQAPTKQIYYKIDNGNFSLYTQPILY